MTTFAGDARDSDQLASSMRFCVEADGTIVATFSECSGLNATVASFKWEEGGANHTTLKFPGRADYGNITLKNGITHSTDLFDWFLQVLRGENARKNVSIKLMTEDLQEIRSWEFSRAFPVKWTGPNLQASSNDTAIESIEFAHDGFIKV